MTTTAAATNPVRKATAPTTTAFAARIRPRAGLADSVVRIRPRRYSAVTNRAPTTTTAISPTKVPARVCVMVTPMPAAPATDGPMSPEPVTLNWSPVRAYPPRSSAGALSGPPMREPVQAWSGPPPLRSRRSKVAVARVGLPLLLAAPSSPPIGAAYGGAVTNSPTCAVGGSCGRRGGADGGPVGAVGRLGAGDGLAGAGQPQPARGGRGGRAGLPGAVVDVVVLHPHPVARR